MEAKMNQVYLSLGSNIECRLTHLNSALELIAQELGQIIRKSAIYETESVGFESEISFYNMCVQIDTAFTPKQLLEYSQEIELKIGRTEKTNGPYSSRKIDIDILFYEDHIIENDTLSIPHKHYQNRNFVLIPLLEINPKLIDPKTGCSIEETQLKCTDKSEVKRTTILI